MYCTTHEAGACFEGCSDAYSDDAPYVVYYEAPEGGGNLSYVTLADAREGFAIVARNADAYVALIDVYGQKPGSSPRDTIRERVPSRYL